jgi:hypothetical protein
MFVFKEKTSYLDHDAPAKCQASHIFTENAPNERKKKTNETADLSIHQEKNEMNRNKKQR